MERQQEARKLKSNQLKSNMSRKVNPKSFTTNKRPLRKQIISSEQSNDVSKSALQGKAKDRVVIESLDWKKSIYYKHVTGEVEEKLLWVANEEMLALDEIDHL